MKFWNFARRIFFAVTLFVVSALAALSVSAAERLALNFNPDWKFIKADPANAHQFEFNDRNWTNVSAPHTYNDTDTFDDWSLVGHRGEQNQWGGRTWYRKTFTVPKNLEGRKVYIEFEAVRQFAEVYINGHLLGISRNGFAPFGFDLTPHVRFGGTNVIAVMCDNRFMIDPDDRERIEASNRSGLATAQRDVGAGGGLARMTAHVNTMIPERVEDSEPQHMPWNNPHWHPAHGGIYRNVRLFITDPLHISLPLYSFLETAGPYAYAKDISEKSARIHVEVPLQNHRAKGENVELLVRVLDRNGRAVLSLKHEGAVIAGAKAQFNVAGVLQNPQLWEPGYPYLYRVACALRVNGETVDTAEIPLGIRTVTWTVDKGFFINGRHVKLQGWGQKSTDEWPGLGAAQPDWMHFLTLDLMRRAGGNFVRWGHVLGGPSQIEAADRLGLVTLQPGVDGEADTRGAAWAVRSATFRDTIIYYRNNPSILIWEGGNQKVSREHAMELRGYMDKYDPHGGRAYAHRRADQITAEFMHVGIGTEGGREIKELPVVEGEYNREESPRRVWDDASPPNFGYPEGKGQTYQLTSEQFAVNQAGHYIRKLSAEDHCGGANWIFSDSTSGGRVASEVARASGEVDGVRLPKEAYYVCQTIFRDDPQVHIIGHWTYPAGTKKTVYVASNCEEVELLVNGRSLGRGKVSDRYIFAFPDVTWTPGEIKAVAYSGGKIRATQLKQTAGKPVALRLTPITGPRGLQADGSDILLIDVEAVDAKGNRCPTFQQRVDFETSGPGIWRGGYNSGKTNSINHTYLDLEAGINRVAVRATRTAGTIVVRAHSKGLKSGSARVKSVPFKAEDGAAKTHPPMPEVILPKTRPAPSAVQSASTGTQTQRQAQSGRFIREFSYSGPTTGVRVERDAQNGKRIYLDSNWNFAGLPEELRGADYIQAANGDRLYNAVDLMEIAVRGGTTVSVAHDDRLDRPDWLTRQFRPTGASIMVDGAPMKIYQHRATRDESLTLGTNTENAQAKAGHMYIVFVNGR